MNPEGTNLIWRAVRVTYVRLRKGRERRWRTPPLPSGISFSPVTEMMIKRIGDHVTNGWNAPVPFTIFFDPLEGQ